jgi:acyl-lipid omega-6 desaturase (Delta-12 desaturase)
LLYTANSWWALVLFAVIRGLTIGPTFIVGHDACHEALTPSPRWNRVLGQMALLPSWHSFTAWRYRHNFIHHRHTQILELDDGYPPADAAQFLRMSGMQRLHYRLSRTIPFAGFLYFPEWLHQQFLPDAASRKAYQLAGRYFALDYALILLWMACEIALFAGAFALMGWVVPSHFSPAVMLFFGIVVTQFFWNWEMGFVTYLHHFHPDVAWHRECDAPRAAERQLISTVHMKFPAGLNWGLFNILEHTVHHIEPEIPLYRLAKAQAALKEAFPGQVTQVPFSLSAVWRTFAVCKIWDPELRRWTGYP